MRRIFSDHAYADDRIKGCYWAETVPDNALDRRPLQEEVSIDVAVIGAGFTGLSTALHLANAGAKVAVLDTKFPGWGASGRNGGFCCLGGAALDDRSMDKLVGRPARLKWRQAEKTAINLVAQLLKTHKIEASVHSSGETILAHSGHSARFENEASACRENYGIAPEIIAKNELLDKGFGGTFHQAMTIPLGFALDPRQYLKGLLDAAEQAGVMVFGHAPVRRMKRDGRRWCLDVADGLVRADQVVIATNGYSSEDVPDWMAARYMPAQSSVMVTRPLTQDEQEAQGWTSDQMAYDTRRLLHYFRKLPNGRFLFGMRGGLRSTRRSETANRRAHLRWNTHWSR